MSAAGMAIELVRCTGSEAAGMDCEYPHCPKSGKPHASIAQSDEQDGLKIACLAWKKGKERQL